MYKIKYCKIKKLSKNKINKLLNECYEYSEYSDKWFHNKKKMINRYNNNKIERILNWIKKNKII